MMEINTMGKKEKEISRGHHIICACHSPYHILHFVAADDEEFYKMNEVGWFEVQLPDMGFWFRLWRGIKYIFGYKSNYGYWDCTVLTIEEAMKLKKYLDEIVLDYNLKIKEKMFFLCGVCGGKGYAISSKDFSDPENVTANNQFFSHDDEDCVE